MAGNFFTMGGGAGQTNPINPTQPAPKDKGVVRTVRDHLVDYLDLNKAPVPKGPNYAPQAVLPNGGNFLTMGNVSPEARSPSQVAEVPDVALERGFQQIDEGNVPKATPAPAATPAAPAAGRDINALFSKVFGDENAPSFDPKSRMDIAKKQELEDFLKKNNDLSGKSDTQIALQYYRQQANAKRK
jgi:hypothetical protein